MAGMPWMKLMNKIGNRAGQSVMVGEGIGQLIQANKAKKRANESTPENLDPSQGAFLAELQQKKNALNTGSEYTSSLDAIGDRMAQTQDVLAGNSGGDAGGTISALLKSQQAANQGEGQLLAQGQQSEGLYTGMYGDLLNKVAQRKMELGLLKRAQNEAEWAQQKQNGMSNLSTGAQSLMNWKGGDQPAQTPATGGDMGSGQMYQGSGLNLNSGVGADGTNNIRQGVQGFKAGSAPSVQKAPLNMGSSNPLGSLMGKSSAGKGVNLSSLGTNASSLFSMLGK